MFDESLQAQKRPDHFRFSSGSAFAGDHSAGLPAVPPLAMPAATSRPSPAAYLNVFSHFTDSGNGEHGAKPADLISSGQLQSALQAERDADPHGPGRSGSLRFRVPTGTDISKMLASHTIPESKLKESIATALTRMSQEGQLAVKDPIRDIMKRLFPSPGKFDESEFVKVVDVADRGKIYKTVFDAQSKVSSTDKPKLAAAMDDAMKLIDRAAADTSGLGQVFGGQAAQASQIYMKAKLAMQRAKADMDRTMDTDYNRDDEQIGLGGWASYDLQHMHLTRKVAQVADESDAIATLIHESCHLADPTVDDKGYYDTSGFEGLSESEKVTNAAHYEELPRRYLHTSKYPGLTFKPGYTATGGKETFQVQVRHDASEKLRRAWDAAVTVHEFLRGIRREIEAGDKSGLARSQAAILEISKVEHLTIHYQAKPETINLNDIVLAEGVARAMALLPKFAEKQSVPATPEPGKDLKHYSRKVIADSCRDYGALTNNTASDLALIDWLVLHYRHAF